MPRVKKDAKILNIKLATSVYDRLIKYYEEFGISKTAATEEILTQYFDSFSKSIVRFFSE